MVAEPSLVMTIDSLDFDSLLAEHANRVYGFVYRLVGSECVDDACQEAWLAIYRALPGFRGEAKVSTWLLSIAHRVCLKQRRRLRLAPGPEPPEELVDPGPSPEHRALDAELAQVVRDAIDQLPAGQREVVHLRQLESYSYVEIADVLELPLGTVRSRLHYGMARLAELLAPYLETPHEAD